jgi:hypothetical protein
MLYLDYIHHELCTTRIPADDARYGAARELALEGIKAIEQLSEAARRAPRTIWIAGDDQHDEPEPIENGEPWELVEEITRLAAQNPNVVALLAAQGRLELVARYLPASDGRHEGA